MPRPTFDTPTRVQLTLIKDSTFYISKQPKRPSVRWTITEPDKRTPKSLRLYSRISFPKMATADHSGHEECYSNDPAMGSSPATPWKKKQDPEQTETAFCLRVLEKEIKISCATKRPKAQKGPRSSRIGFLQARCDGSNWWLPAGDRIDLSPVEGHMVIIPRLTYVELGAKSHETGCFEYESRRDACAGGNKGRQLIQTVEYLKFRSVSLLRA